MPGFLRMEVIMKRAICLISCVSILLCTGCGSSAPGSRVGSQPTGAKDVIESQIAAAESTASETTASLPTEETTTVAESVTESVPETSADTSTDTDEDCDIDLTIDNADLIYATVFAMVYTPEDYVGKTVKMKGQFVFYYDEEKGVYYYACLIKDAMACCAQGLEFVPAGDCTYPDDFPPAMTEINVTGTFNILEDDGETYCALTDAVYYY